MADLHHRRAAVRLRLAKPLATAYLLGLLSSVGPRLTKVLLLFFKRKLRLHAAWLQLCSILHQAVALHRFPTFCGVLIGGSTLFQLPIARLILSVSKLAQLAPIPPDLSRLLTRFLAALISASISFRLLNHASSMARKNKVSVSQPQTHLDVCVPGPFDDPPEKSSLELETSILQEKSLSRADLAGRTIDLSLFAAIRALDVILGSLWDRLTTASNSARLHAISKSTPPILFCFSAATIMHAWFYSPSRLPTTYNHWISTAAELDRRLVLALRHARYGTWIYGKDTGMAPLLGSMCRDYGLPESYGDPAKTCPVPCELVHMGYGKSCEKHALIRFGRGWLFAAKMYAPLQMFVLARNARARRRPGNLMRISWDDILRASFDATRSSAFLGAFVAFFYYGVCLSRTRLGPKLFSRKSITPQMWDSGLCILGGCLFCGWSILLEHPKKRLEILFFVLPRAAATWFPRRYLPEHRWKEHFAFTLSAAIVLTAAQEAPKRVRGVFGKILHSILKID